MSNLAEKLAEATAIKQEMARLLQDLEAKATGQPAAKPGYWRHHPAEWDRAHPAKKPN
jgi:hypothetical protein